jgi:hypothetical protein
MTSWAKLARGWTATRIADAFIFAINREGSKTWKPDQKDESLRATTV